MKAKRITPLISLLFIAVLVVSITSLAVTHLPLQQTTTTKYILSPDTLIKTADIIVFKENGIIKVVEKRGQLLYSGTSADDAFDIAIENGEKIVVLPETYTFNRTMVILKKVHIIGAGTTVEKPVFALASNANKPLLWIGNATAGIRVGGVLIEGIYFDGNKEAQREAHPLIVLDYFNDILMDKCWVWGSKGDGLYINDGWTFKFMRGAIEGNDGYAIYVTPISTTTRDFIYIAETNIAGKIYIGDSVWFINNNVFSGWLEIYGRALIKGNRIYGSGSIYNATIVLLGNNAIITDNIIDSSHTSIQYTFYVSSNAKDGFIITNNKFLSWKGFCFEDGYKRMGRTIFTENQFEGIQDPLTYEVSTDATGKITISFPFSVSYKPIVYVIIEGNYTYYIDKYTETWSNSGIYNGVIIQVVDWNGVAVGSGVNATIKLIFTS